jgi:hypothetical protein
VKQYLAMGLLMAGFAGPVMAEPWTGNANVLVGSRKVSGDWGAVDGHSAFGVQTDIGQTDWPLLIALDYLYSYDSATEDGVSSEANVSTIDLGIRKEAKWGNHLRPSVGLGSSMVFGRLESGGVSDSDSAVGVWLSGALVWRLADAFNVGFEARYNRANLDLLDKSRSTAGTFLGTTLGLHW